MTSLQTVHSLTDQPQERKQTNVLHELSRTENEEEEEERSAQIYTLDPPATSVKENLSGLSTFIFPQRREKKKTTQTIHSLHNPRPPITIRCSPSLAQHKSPPKLANQRAAIAFKARKFTSRRQTTWPLAICVSNLHLHITNKNTPLYKSPP